LLPALVEVRGFCQIQKHDLGELAFHVYIGSRASLKYLRKRSEKLLESYQELRSRVYLGCTKVYSGKEKNVPLNGIFLNDFQAFENLFVLEILFS